jgi:glycosidase
VPFVYYGEEIGMTGDKPDELLRTPMQWTAGAHAGFTTGTPWAKVNAGSEACNVEVQGAEAASLLNLYRRLIHLRNGNPALATGGTWMVQSDTPGVVAFLRHRVTRAKPDGGPDARGAAEARPRLDSVLVVVNLSAEAVGACGLSLEASPVRGELAARDLLSESVAPVLKADERGGFAGYQAGPLPAQSAKILVLSPK